MNRVFFLVLLATQTLFAQVYHADQKTTAMHTPFRWVWADSAARVAQATTKRDTTKIGYQVDDFSVWYLVDSLPTWNRVGTYKADSLTVAGTITADSLNARSGEFTGTLNVDSLHSTKGITATTGTFSGALSSTTLNTGNGNYELFAMDQDVLTTSSPTFVTVTGALSGNATTATTATNVSGGSVNATTGTFSGDVLVANGSSGASYHTETVIGAESNSSAAISMLTPNNQVAYMFFGDPDNNIVGRLAYNHADNSMIFVTNSTNETLIDQNGNFKHVNDSYIGITSDSDLLQLTSGQLNISGSVSATTGTFSGALSSTTLNTGNGNYELFAMDQDVLTTSSPTFVTVTGALSGNATTATTATNVSGGSVNATTGTFSGDVLVANGSSGASYHTETVIGAESNSSAAISMLTPNNQVAYMFFGDPDNNIVGRLAYNHADNSMIFVTNSTNETLIDQNGNFKHVNDSYIGITSDSDLLQLTSGQLNISGSAQFVSNGTSSGIVITGDNGNIDRIQANGTNGEMYIEATDQIVLSTPHVDIDSDSMRILNGFKLGSAISDLAEFNYFDTGSFPCTLSTSFVTVQQTGRIKYQRTGYQVTLVFPAISGTSTTTDMTLLFGSAPSSIQPSTEQWCELIVQSNGSYVPGSVAIATTFTSANFRTLSSGAYDTYGFVDSGTKGIATAAPVTYLVN